ncbi:hypothetical protein [Winogradskyella sp. A3E31]|uniref:hypothetical protein n=1 Tax=Winogradskyella sp. A3E31 TaxID=3349637 RepID=UPI00398B03E1
MLRICRLLLFSCLLVACDNNEFERVEITDPLHGTWNLLNEQGGDFSPINIDYEPGEKTWTFNSISGVMTITDNLNPNYACALCNSSRDYIVTENDTGSSSIGSELIKWVEYSEDGSINGTIIIGGITSLSETELIVTSHNVAPLIWTLTKAEEDLFN